MSDKQISVIVPVYNVERYLGRCVKSVLEQTYPNLEIILVDDGSTDSSPEICDRMALTDERIKVVHKKNGGLSSARNAGLDVATGDYVSFIDSDDFIAPDFYETLLAHSDVNETIACSHIVRIDENDVVTPRKDPHIAGDVVTAEMFVRELLLHIGDVSVCSKLFDRSLIGEERFDETKLNEDLLFMMNLLKKVQNISFTGKVGYYYLCRSGSISSKFGKAIEDMAYNSLWVRNFVFKNYPSLKEEANRFALFQHMAYLLLIPKHLRTKSNPQYLQVRRYINGHFVNEGLLNKYLTKRNKIILIGQMIVPGMIANRYQKTH